MDSSILLISGHHTVQRVGVQWDCLLQHCRGIWRGHGLVDDGDGSKILAVIHDRALQFLLFSVSGIHMQ